ncbi:MAG TPA: MipA/OmpV family protein [Noviherbaspirillum sp.]|jgi:outer membrane scaffolding protein for murein synthesis (MipA/OmpV family)|uniref:MipA/OmpV family protein n=1 Tax=Noviherbaspirillum sp. TaxID=1926288 RepID=UPI002F9311AB
MKKLLGLVVLSLALPCHADLQPRWEVGFGVGAVSIPDYRGAENRSGYLLPVPYFVYRGDVLQADRGGVRAALLDRGNVQLNLSLNGSVPVSADDNPQRRGMPDLRPAVEIGPTADIRLWQAVDRKSALSLRLPLRAAVTVESSPRHVGWLFAPGLSFTTDAPAGLRGWKLGVQGGPLYADSDYSSYFYGVRPDQVAAGRPAYDAPGGFAGTQFTATLSRRFARYWIGGFLRHDSLRGAAFRDSPLVRQRDGVSVGLAVAWIFGASSELVDAGRDR